MQQQVPAVGWDKEVLYKYEKEFAEKRSAKPLRVYMTVGDVERGRPTFERFAAQMASRKLYICSSQIKSIREYRDIQELKVKHLAEACNMFLKSQS
jgi:hypothetical protein